MPEYAYVYILANGFKKIYIGITTNLEERIFEHKSNKHPQATPPATTYTPSSTSNDSPASLRPSLARNNSKAGSASASCSSSSPPTPLGAI
jgi:hypothetical protein